MTQIAPPCQAFADDLAAVVSGDDALLALHLDHLSGCDACRDARHDAVHTARALGEAGADFVLPRDLADRILAELDTQTIDRIDLGAARPQVQPAPLAPSPAEPAAALAPAATPIARAQGAAAAPRPITARRSRSRTWLIAGSIAASAAAAWLITHRDPRGGVAVAPARGLGAELTRTDRAANDGVSGLAVRAPGGHEFREVAVAEVKQLSLLPGSALQTDARTRVELALSDGSELTIDQDSIVELPADGGRHIVLERGRLLADIAHLEAGPHARLDTPHGRVEVLGTRFVLSASTDATSVQVTRGLVRLTSAAGAVEVRPGEEGTIERDLAPAVSPVSDLAEAVSFAELGPQDAEVGSAGIGELTARRPGATQDREAALRLARHQVTVRIAGNVARTEIEEVFANDSASQLEGIYRFPLPADAQIDRLALDVDGKLVDGAFVAKDHARKIWNGAIKNAEPTLQIARNEIVWVPGPWRDPAKLDWQRGGRFELRIFPIPAKGARTIKIGYTQVVAPQGAVRRYVYPMARAKDAAGAIGQLDVDVRVAGADPDVPVRARGYALAQSQDGDATRLALHGTNFLPAGDLVIEYALPDRQAELRAWSFAGNAAAAPTVRAGAKDVDADVVAAQQAVASDDRATALIALRPTLPRWTAEKARDYVIVLDSSQSMVGERFDRARKLITAMVAQMDRRDRFTVLACDVTCQDGGSLRPASSHAAAELATWLAGLSAAGASDVVAALRRGAREIATTAEDRESWLLYVGDGMASVGYRKASDLVAETAALAKAGTLRVTAIGVGGDADATALAGLARAGGGHYVPYVPGRTAQAMALSVLETSYGVSLDQPEVILPAGLEDASPGTLATLRAGDELLVAARFRGDIKGDVILRGKVAGKPYENRFPLTLTASTARGNAFVPRLWAAMTIARLEEAGRGEDRAKLVALSQGYGVLSRETSLLVLESPAMFKAFGIDRAQPTAQWTGDEADESVVSAGLTDYGLLGGVTTAKKAPAAMHAAMARGKGALGADEGDNAGAGFGGGGNVAGETKAEEEQPELLKTDDLADGPAPVPDAPRDWEGHGMGRRGGSYMRREYYTEGSVGAFDQISPSIVEAVVRTEAALRANPDSRDRHRDLVQALSYAGDLDRAYQVAESWLERDRLDPEALGYMADILGREGKRDEAVRMLSGVVDLEPDNATLHRRLAAAYERAGLGERACAHRQVLAELLPGDADAVARALRCERAIGEDAGAARLLVSLADAKLRDRAEVLAGLPVEREATRGQLVLHGSWTGAHDLDLSVVTPQGTRLSWLGGRPEVVGDHADTIDREELGLRRIKRGNYLIEIARVDPEDSAPVAGTIEVDVLGQKRTLSFRLDGGHVVVGRVQVVRKSRLVPYAGPMRDGPGWGGVE